MDHRTPQQGEAGFDAFAATHWRLLMRSAWLLTGDWAAAEDLVQTSLLKSWQAWDRVSSADSPLAYVHRIIGNEFLSGRRRRMSGELPVAVLPHSAAADPTHVVDRRMALVDALGTLPPLQRLTIVLRYFDDLTVEQTAATLGCSVGNVKSQSSRALKKLRTSACLDHLEREIS